MGNSPWGKTSPDSLLPRTELHRVYHVGGPNTPPLIPSTQHTTSLGTAKVDRAPNNCSSHVCEEHRQQNWHNVDKCQTAHCCTLSACCRQVQRRPSISNWHLRMVANKAVGQRRQSEVTLPGKTLRARHSGVASRSSKTMSSKFSGEAAASGTNTQSASEKWTLGGRTP